MPSPRPPAARPRTDARPAECPRAESVGEPSSLSAIAPGRDAVLALFLREAPRLAEGGDLGAATCAVDPWPHQLRVVRATVERYPQSFLFCDEVGLGKTIEAGLALRQLWISGRVRRALVLVPKAVLRQWQEELHEKLCLSVPRLDGGRFVDVHGRSVADPDSSSVDVDNPWNRHPLVLASTQLARRPEQRRALMAAEPWDLVIVDEAHHARRRRTAGGARPNRLLELLAGPSLAGVANPVDPESDSRAGLAGRSRCLYLLTATPMQVDPREAWDLLRLLGLGGRWGGSESDFLGYFEQLRLPFAERDWRLTSDLLRESLDGLAAGDRPVPDSSIADAVEALLAGPAADGPSADGPSADGRRADVLGSLDEAARRRLDSYLRRATPIRRRVWRHTRPLLRRYRAAGLLDAAVPERRPEAVWIEMTPGERALYERIEHYLGLFYQRYEARRPGLGFVMTVYRRRLTSSFHAIARSLARRRRRLDDREEGEHESASRAPGSREPVEVGVQAELFAERLPTEGEGGEPVSADERAYLDAFLDQLEALATDSKLERLRAELERILAERDRVLIFTQYLDTLDHLRESLAERYSVACYSGRGGEVRAADRAWRAEPKEALKAAFGRGEIQVLLCTEAASEGLNLQTCGVLINYDVPWNPMRVEQRIGRIDRIGQRHGEVWIYNYFYADTVEATVYQRLDQRIDGFRQVVGELQPILRRVEPTIQALAMTPAARRRQADALESLDARHPLGPRSDTPPPNVLAVDPEEAIGERQKLDSASELPGALAASRPIRVPVGLAEVEQVLAGAAALAGRLELDDEEAGLYRLDGERRVTFDRALFDRRPYSVELATWGTAVFDQLLDAVAGALPGQNRELGREPGLDEPAGLGLYRSRNPAPVALFVVPTAEPGGGEVVSIGSLRALRTWLEGRPRRWTAEEESAASTLFSRHRQQMLRGMRAVEARRRRTEQRALLSEAVEILARATVLERARTRNPGLFDEPPHSPDRASRGEPAEPFATLWRWVDERGARADVETAAATRARQAEASPATVERRWTALVERGRELVAREVRHRLGSRRGTVDAPGAGPPGAGPPGAGSAGTGPGQDGAGSVLLERAYFAVGSLDDPPWRPQALEPEAVRPFENAVPLFHSLDGAVVRLLDAAREGYDPDRLSSRRPGDHEWLGAEAGFRPAPGLFVAPIATRAMEDRWPAGSWVLFRIDPRPPGPGRAALLHHPDWRDPETGELALLRVLHAARPARSGGQAGAWSLRGTSSGPAGEAIEVSEPDGWTVLAVPVTIVNEWRS